MCESTPLFEKLIINPDYSATSAACKSKTRVTVFRKSVCLHICVTIYELFRGSIDKDSCVLKKCGRDCVCVLDSCKSSNNENFMSVCRDMTRHLPEQPVQTTKSPWHTHVNKHCNSPPCLSVFCVYELAWSLRRVFSFPGPSLPGMKKMFLTMEGNSSIVSERLQRDFTTCAFVSGVLRARHRSHFLSISCHSFHRNATANKNKQDTQHRLWNPNLTLRLISKLWWANFPHLRHTWSFCCVMLAFLHTKWILKFIKDSKLVLKDFKDKDESGKQWD